MLKLIIFGPPGSGKGTYSSRLKEIFGIEHISTGDIFREEIKKGSELGKEVKKYVEKGELVPDEIVNEVVKEKIEKVKGFILDGYPRTLNQAKFLLSITKIDAIIDLLVPEWVIVERLSSRVVCEKCGKVYNLRFLKPKVEGICDVCGGKLVRREDDEPEIIKERFRIYEEMTKPVKEFLRKQGVKFIEIKCESVDIPPEKIVKEISEKLSKLLNDNP